jgi:GNAT superfamily N-acetyltransferase
MNVKAWIGNPANVMMLATIERQIAGIGCLRTDGHIILNYVAPRYRFRGVSRTILALLERHAQDLGLPSLQLESTKTAYRFYQDAGFADVRPPEIKHGIPIYPMSKRLG